MERIALAVVLLLSAGLSQAGIYKWQDADGVTHYGSQGPKGARLLAIETSAPTAQTPVETPAPALPVVLPPPPPPASEKLQ